MFWLIITYSCMLRHEPIFSADSGSEVSVLEDAEKISKSVNSSSPAGRDCDVIHSHLKFFHN